MNDFDYEVKQRRELARQVKHRKRGSRSKKCSLPSDGMTHKQWKERNGEVLEYNLKKPMAWEKFKRLPRDVQQLYICTLQEQYSIPVNRIASMLGVCDQTMYNYIKRNDLVVQRKLIPTKEQRIEWRHFCDGEQDVFGREAAIPEGAQAEPDEIVKESQEPPRKPAMQLDHVTLNFKGPFNLDTVRNSLALILENGQEVEISITCSIL